MPVKNYEKFLDLWKDADPGIGGIIVGNTSIVSDLALDQKHSDSFLED